MSYRLTFLVCSLSLLFAHNFALAKNEAIAAVDENVSEITETQTIEPRENRTRLNVGPGLYLLEGELGWSLNIGLVYQVSDSVPVYVGLDSGVSMISDSASSGSFSAEATVTCIRFLPTAYYRFGKENSNVNAYVGLSIGPVIEIGSFSASSGTRSASDSKTELDLEVAFRPGVEFAFSPTASLGIEPRLGIQSGEFIFTPQVHGIFSF